MAMKIKFVVGNVILSGKSMKVKPTQHYNEENLRIKLDLSFWLILANNLEFLPT